MSFDEDLMSSTNGVFGKNLNVPINISIYIVRLKA